MVNVSTFTTFSAKVDDDNGEWMYGPNTNLVDKMTNLKNKVNLHVGPFYNCGF